MTCIVALSYNNKVYMGGDAASVDEDSSLISSRKEPKIFIKNGYLLGYAGSFRFGKVLQHTFNPPKLSDDDIDKFLNTTFVNALRECCELNKVDPGSEEDSSEMLIGVAGRVFEFCNDWHFGEDINDFNAIGSGAKFALGSLYSTRRLRSPNARMQLALESAERFSTSVRGPFTILEL